MDKVAAIKELTDLFKECNTLNWDGYNANSVTAEHYNIALKVLESLHPNLPPPFFCADPYGCICFEWYRDKKNLVTFSVELSSSLIYLAVIGDKTWSGIAEFGTEFPPLLQDLIEKVIKED